MTEQIERPVKKVTCNDGRDHLNIEPLEIFADGRTVARQVLSSVPGGRWNTDETVMRISEEGL